MQSGAIRELHDVVARDGDLRAQRVVGGVRVRHERVEPVVAAFQLDQHEEPAVVGHCAGAAATATCAAPNAATAAQRAPRAARRRSGGRCGGPCGSPVAWRGGYLSWYDRVEQRRADERQRVASRRGRATAAAAAAAAPAPRAPCRRGVAPGRARPTSPRRSARCAGRGPRLRRNAARVVLRRPCAAMRFGGRSAGTHRRDASRRSSMPRRRAPAGRGTACARAACWC